MRLSCTSLMFFSVLLLSILKIKSQEDPRVEAIQEYWKDLEANHRISGSAAVFANGSMLSNHQAGVAFPPSEAPKNPPPPNNETLYRIGSITKTFTSVMILQLVEEGKLTLDTPLENFFPSMTNADRITIELLLRHKSGLSSFTDPPEYTFYYKEPQTREQMIERMAAWSPDFEPGTRTEYSNTNYALLGYIIEDVTNSTYAEQIKTRIVSPIDGMERTAYMTPASVDDNVAFSVLWDPALEQWTALDETDPSVPHGAGSLMSTPTELIVFIRSLFSGSVINETTLAAMTDVDEETGTGMGIFEYPLNEHMGFGHDGAIDGFASLLVYYPEEDVVNAVIANGIVESETITMNEVTLTLESIALGEEPPDFSSNAQPERGLAVFELSCLVVTWVSLQWVK